MRSSPVEYEMTSPETLGGVLQLLHDEPGRWMPVAGATEVMVQFGAGKLPARRLVNLWGLKELAEIRLDAHTLTLGGGCTFSQIRACEAVRRHFPLLAQAASWTGGIANQNRATLAGNIVNASPAADSPPALLAYDAELELVSVRGTRRMPYSEFHLGYKKTALQQDELVLSVRLNTIFDGYFSYGRKTGARNAQAISKVCMAAVGRMEAGRVGDVRIGMGAVAPVPLRLKRIETLVRGGRITDGMIAEARRELDAAMAPIDDIRSVAEYRRSVAGNLLEEFLRGLAATGEALNPVLASWNVLPAREAAEAIVACCGAQRWAREMEQRRPFRTSSELLETADQVWWGLSEEDWEQAFQSHPRIGERKAATPVSGQSEEWSRQEQAGIGSQDAGTLAELARRNAEYEARFGRVFLVCASGRSAAEILEILNRRLDNDAAMELRETAEQQRQITQLRLQRWFKA